MSLARFSVVILLAATGCSTLNGPSATETAKLYLSLGNAALLENDPTGALQHLAKAEKEDPDLAEIYHSKALAFHAKSDLKQALIEAGKAAKLDPEYMDGLNTYGQLLIEAGRFAEAKPHLERAGHEPTYRDAYKPLTALGIHAYKQGEFEEARKLFDKAIVGAPMKACLAHYYRGHLELRESHFKEAIKSYDEATKRFCTNFSDAHLALGIAYEQSSDYHRARKKFLEIQDRYPNTAVAEKAMGRLRKLP